MPGKRRSAANRPPDATRQPLSAQVIVRAASGRALRGAEPLQASNLAAHAPRAADVEVAREYFASQGFTLGDFLGISFAITADADHFARTFGVTLAVSDDGAITVRRNRKSLGLELPSSSLPAAVAAVLETVTFTPPAELYGGGLMP